LIKCNINFVITASSARSSKELPKFCLRPCCRIGAEVCSNRRAHSVNDPTKTSYSEDLERRAERQAQLDAIVKAATDVVASTIADREPNILTYFFYGASGINPRNLVTWYLLANDIVFLTRSQLTFCGYPQEAIPLIHVAFASDEDIQIKAGGNYYYYFK
jgi:hypothetical protein